MRLLFLYVAEKLSSDDQLLHWELLMDAYSKIMSQNSIIDKSVNSEAEYLITNRLSEKELIAEDDEHEKKSQKNELSFIKRDLTNHDNENR